MKCSNCGHDMIKTKVGWLCHNCGHAETGGDADKSSNAATPVNVQASESHGSTDEPETTTPPAPKPDLPEPPAPPTPPTATESDPPTRPTGSHASMPAQILHQPPKLTVPTSITPDSVSSAAPQITPLVPPAPVASTTNGWTDPMANAPKPKRRLPKFLIILLPLLLLVGGASAAGYWYTFKQQPKQAVGAYLGKLATAKTASYNGTISFDPPTRPADTANIGAAIDKTSVTLAGAYDLKDNNNPKLKLNVTGSFGSQSVSGDLLVVDKALFFKIGSLGLLNSFGITLSNDWYKLPLDSTFNDNACYNQTKGKSGTILGQHLLTNLPTKNTKRVGLFQTVNGHKVTHYKGAVDFSRIQSYIDKANQALPAQCKLTYNASDFKGVTLSYDVYSGSNFDRLDIAAGDTSGGGTTHITMDTSGYNKPVDIKAPANPKDIKDLISLFTGGSGDGGAVDTTQAQDAQRKADLRAVKNALETYFNDNNYYPPGNYAGLGKYLMPGYIPSMPTDPTAGHSYSYTPAPKGCKLAKCTSYVLDATLENTKDTQIKAGTTNLYEVLSTN